VALQCWFGCFDSCCVVSVDGWLDVLYEECFVVVCV